MKTAQEGHGQQGPLLHIWVVSPLEGQGYLEGPSSHNGNSAPALSSEDQDPSFYIIL